MFVLAAFTLGFLGSFHCVGMCGPIALAIPVKRTSTFSIVKGSLLYNIGRATTYAIMGLLFGLIGQGFALAGLQNILSVTLGIVILAFLFIPKLSAISAVNKGIVFSFLQQIKKKLNILFGTYSSRSLFMIGFLNGLLPCGLVYMGIASSIATGDTLKGAVFMASFGLGTFPAMLSITLLRERINIRFRERIRKVMPVFIGIMATMLIFRGMNLGIPYISPSVEKSNGIVHHQCCHK